MKHLFHDFIGQLPDNSLMQLLSFSTELKFDQVFTSRKSELLQALGNLKAVGGTDILNSVYVTYHSLKQIPSEKRVIVYVTDAALDVEEDKKTFFEEMLNGIKEEGIQVLWVGLGTKERHSIIGRERGRYVQWMVLILVQGFIIPGIDNAAHIGGFVGGFIIAYLAGSKAHARGDDTLWKTLAWVCVAITGYSFFRMAQQLVSR